MESTCNPAAPATDLAATFPDLSAAEHAQLAQALDLCDPAAVETALEVASILNQLRVDIDTLSAAIVQVGAQPGADDLPRVAQAVGAGVATLVAGIGTMEAIPALSERCRARDTGAVSAENLRKMLIAMIDDVRVVPVSLASRLQLLRSLKSADAPRRREIAEETLDVFAPLANRLGIGQLKWELEDLSLRFLEADAYRRIAGKLAEKRVNRERFIEAFIAILDGALRAVRIDAEINGRPKHIYSIWKKMHKKGVEFEHIFDVRAVRILVDNVADCYAALGIVHTHWPHVTGEFDDYIATPKPNGYQSIHTAVVGPAGKIVEVQIRTRDMHRENELGVAAHWRYKESIKHDAGLENKVLWLRQLLAWKDEVNDDLALAAHFRSDVFDERVYVFTPRGQAVDLPAGATPLDFAYAIHTEVGHRCRGAKVNGRIVPLTYQLQNGERVEILTVKKGGPSRDWMSAGLGYLHTARARTRVAHWFKLANYEQNMAGGRTALERELQRLGTADASFEKLAQELGFRKTEDFLAAIGSGNVKVAQAVAPLRGRIERNTRLPTRPALASRDPSATDFEVLGVGNLLTHMAQCCHPLPGDTIVGYITRTRGITIHRRDCTNILRLNDADHDRLVEVRWGHSEATRYPANIRVTAFDRPGLLHDVTVVLADARVNVAAVSLHTDETERITTIDMTIEIAGLESLSAVLIRIGNIANVTAARRIGA